MGDAKKEEPAFVMQASADENQQQVTKKIASRKFLVIGACAVIVTALIIGGFLMAFFFMAKTTEHITKETKHFKDDNGKDVKEDIEKDENANTVYFKVDQGENGIHHIIHDYNRKLAVTKADEGDSVRCYVHALNTSSSGLKALTGADKNPNHDSPAAFSIDPNPIATPDFLAPRAQEMCKGHPVYWAIPACMDEKFTGVQDPGREKRQVGVCITSCCWKFCARTVVLRIFYIGGQRYCNFLYTGYIAHYRVC